MEQSITDSRLATLKRWDEAKAAGIPTTQFVKQEKIGTATLYTWNKQLRGGMGRKSYTTTPNRDQAFADLRSGMSVRDVGEKYKVHATTVYEWKRKMKAQGRSEPQATNDGVDIAPKIAKDGRKMFTEEQRVAILAEWAKADVNGKVFAKRLGLSEPLLYKWRSIARLRNAAEAKNRRDEQQSEKDNGSPVVQAPVQQAPHHESALHCPECGCDIVAAFEKLILKLQAMKSIRL